MTLRVAAFLLGRPSFSSFSSTTESSVLGLGSLSRRARPPNPAQNAGRATPRQSGSSQTTSPFSSMSAAQRRPRFCAELSAELLERDEVRYRQQ